MTPSKLDEVGQYTLKKNNPKVESLMGNERIRVQKRRDSNESKVLLVFNWQL